MQHILLKWAFGPLDHDVPGVLQISLEQLAAQQREAATSGGGGGGPRNPSSSFVNDSFQKG